jgi:hypothetical protein
VLKRTGKTQDEFMKWVESVALVSEASPK